MPRPCGRAIWRSSISSSVANGNKTLGFINPSLYTIGAGSSYGTDFHDVTSGSNGYSATTGYDLATGWGSPKGSGLINALAGSVAAPGFSLSASPGLRFNCAGWVRLLQHHQHCDRRIQYSGRAVSLWPALRRDVTFASPGSISGTGSLSMSITVATSVAPGTYPITVTGTAGSTVESTTVSLTVTAPVTAAFAISVSPTSGSLDQGQSGYAVVTTTVSGGFSSAITLSATGLPSGVTGSFSPNPIAAPGSGTTHFTLTVSRTAKTGTYPITITGTGGGITHTTALTFQVLR
ncbi:MAG: hypothetical protein WDM87_17615 [Terracidiphilus sp.]